MPKSKSNTKDVNIIVCKCGIKYKIKNKEKHAQLEQHKKFLLNQFIVYFE